MRIVIMIKYKLLNKKNIMKKILITLAIATISAVAAFAISHTGGAANKYCPIWNIEYSSSIGSSIGTTVTCKTGGSYKCETGRKCPHGA